MYIHHEHDELASLSSQFTKHDISLLLRKTNVAVYQLSEFLYVYLLLDSVRNLYLHVFKQIYIKYCVNYDSKYNILYYFVLQHNDMNANV
jgi:hypothetical protein